MRYLWVGLGGAVGSIARYAISLNIDSSHFPWATLGINLSGAFVLGAFLTLALGHLSVAVMTPIAVGVIGGYTTFSTFEYEANDRLSNGAELVALTYILSSVILGLLAVYLGVRLARM